MAVIDIRNAVLKIQDGSTPPNEIAVTIGSGDISWNDSRNVEYVFDRNRIYGVKQGEDIPLPLDFSFMWEELTGVQTTLPADDTIASPGSIGETTVTVTTAIDASFQTGLKMTLDGEPTVYTVTGYDVARTVLTIEPALVADVIATDVVAFTAYGLPTVLDALQVKGFASHWKSVDNASCTLPAVNVVIENLTPCPEVPSEKITFPSFRYGQLGFGMRAGEVSVSGTCLVTSPTVATVV